MEPRLKLLVEIGWKPNCCMLPIRNDSHGHRHAMPRDLPALYKSVLIDWLICPNRLLSVSEMIASYQRCLFTAYTTWSVAEFRPYWKTIHFVVQLTVLDESPEAVASYIAVLRIWIEYHSVCLQAERLADTKTQRVSSASNDVDMQSKCKLHMSCMHADYDVAIYHTVAGRLGDKSFRRRILACMQTVVLKMRWLCLGLSAAIGLSAPPSAPFLGHRL